MKIMKEVKRMCIVCREMKDKKMLNRVVFDKSNNNLVFDKTGKANGRGAYICKSIDCMNMIEKKNVFNRNFKFNFDKEKIKMLCEEIIEYEKQN